jgi:ribosomal protein L16 Arg81 hydroxylase
MAEKWLNDPLGYLLGPERVDDFFARIYEKEALVVRHNAPERFKGLMSIDDVDRLVTSVDLKEGQLDLADAKSSRRMQRTDYIDAGGYVDRGAVADFHRGGATIILQQAHQLEPTLGRFCRALEYIFSCHVQTNLYLTPPSAQGFRTHYDNHCVFVLQMQGEKAWRLFEKPVDTPFRGEEFQMDVHESGELKQEFVLKAGDCAYVPRGMMHDASTSGDEASLHVTVGLITRTWADLMLEAISEAALRSPDARRSLPPGYSNQGFDREPWRAHLRKLALALAGDVELDPAMDLIGDAFIRSRAADNRGAVRDASKGVGAAEPLRRQPFAPYRIAEDGDRLVLISPGGELAYPTAERARLERALSGAPFTASELGGENPEDFAAKLLAYGLLARA